jgi:hypothetical protein
MQEPYLDVNGRPLLIRCRILKSTSSEGLAEGLVLVKGTKMSIRLRTALKLIRLGFCERVHKKRRKSGSRRKKEWAAKQALAASLANPEIIIEKVE